MANKKMADPSQFIKGLSDMLTLITNHGFGKIMEAIIIICFGIGAFTIALNPEKIFDAFIQGYEQQETENREFRKTNDPIIRNHLHDVVYELGAIRASVMEFHNGKENPSGLGFLYADMTYDMPRDGYASIVAQYQDINLSGLNLPVVLYNDGFGYGTMDELKKIDPKLGSMMEQNGTTGASFLLLSGSNDLGILILSFNHQPEDIQHIGRVIRKLGITVATKLDYENRGI